MKLTKRFLAGALGGLGGTVVLSGVRDAWKLAGVVSDTAPDQVVGRAEDLGLLDFSSPRSRRLAVLAAHYLYGGATGAAFGVLRREVGGPVGEVSTGTALGLLAWGVGWAVWLPLAGIHSSPWTQRTPKVLLPPLDHVVFGASWGLLYWALTKKTRFGDE